MKTLIRLWALALILLLTPATALAQGIDPQPPTPGAPIPPGGPIRIELHSIDAVIDGPIATVQVKQVFRNQAAWQVEGVYLFPLPADASIGDFQMRVDGQVWEGEVLDAQEARGIYEEIVRRRQDPALLEYVGSGLFRASVFPIPPGAERTIAFTYNQALPLHNGLYHFRYPLPTRQFSAQPVQTLSLRVELRNQPGLRTLYSPSHDVSIDRSGPDAALVGYEATHAAAEQDFDLYFGVSPEAIGLNLLSYKPAGEDGFFLLLAAPGLETAPAAVVQRDLILVLDISGSMEGEKLAQAKQAAQAVLNHLNPGDRFNLIAFSTGVRLWQGELQPVDATTLAKARSWLLQLSANGSTDINRALLEALAQFAAGAGERPAYLLFLTDGLPTQGETGRDRIIANALRDRPDRSLRLFTFGVGYDVDTLLLDGLSADLGGRSSYVRPNERIDEAVGDFASRISTPVLSQVSLELPGVLIEETYPYPVPDLFAGEQILLAGRYRSGGETTVLLTGEINGQPQRYTFSGQRLVSAGGDPFVARLWATRKIGALLDQIRRQGYNQEAVDAIVQLSKEYGVVTPYTSYLVMEEQETSLRTGGGPSAPPLPSAPRQIMPTITVQQMMAAPASGEAAVADSQVRSALRLADRADEQQGVRFVAGKTFIQQGRITGADGNPLALWVDSAYREEMTLIPIPFGSDAYFALAADPAMAAWLAISPELTLVWDGVAYRISSAPVSSPGPATPVPTPAPPDLPSATPAPTPSDLPTATPAPAPDLPTPGASLWDSFLAWLRGLLAPPR